MIVVDASCLAEVVVGGRAAEPIATRLASDADHCAPHIIDAEVFGVVRRQYLHGHLDRTEASQAVEDLGDWPGERFSLAPLLGRAWELRDTVGGWDAMYVALAEALGVTLLTTDRRLALASGPLCPIELLGPA